MFLGAPDSSTSRGIRVPKVRSSYKEDTGICLAETCFDNFQVLLDEMVAFLVFLRVTNADRVDSVLLSDFNSRDSIAHSFSIRMMNV